MLVKLQCFFIKNFSIFFYCNLFTNLNRSGIV
nr:MAG TPA: hypothetical protein [Caudoviricetes sp.]